MGLEFLFSALGKSPSPPSTSSNSKSDESTSAPQSTPSAPPLLEHSQARSSLQSNAGDPLPPCQPVVAMPKLEAQPWVRRLAGVFKKQTVGIARVDLRRPTAPPAQQYVEGNILFFRQDQGQGQGQGREARRDSRQRGTGRRGRGTASALDTSNPFAPIPVASSATLRQQEDHPVNEGKSSTGARIKITRNLHLFKDKEELKRPLIDLGLGLSIEMDGQHFTPIARVKFADVISIKALPRLIVKVSTKIPLLTSGLGLKLLYELPLSNIHQPWNPPSRLMVRLETAVGSGFHISPTGIEVDERMVHFGSNLSLRAAVGLNFPRSLPIDWEQEDSSFKFKIHRLSIRSIW